MASQHLFLSSPSFSLPFKTSTYFPKLPFRSPKIIFKVLAGSSAPSTEQAMLEAVAQTEGNFLPCVRSYENDMARLSLSGKVGFEQALTAAAADGGESSGEHVDAGLSTMVVETVYPGPDDDHSTVSTRLFLPARKVKEKARKLRNSIPKDILSSTNSRNILAMTFRQVVVQQLWNFELAIFIPGSQRNMEDLGSQREVTASFALSSSDEKVISGLGEAVCLLALESTQREVFYGSSGKSNGFFRWFSKTQKFSSKDSSITVYRFEDEIVENAKSLLDKFNLVRAKYKMTNKKPARSAWTSLLYSKLEKIGGSEFSIWTSEYVPAYRLEIDADRLTDLKFEGWKKSVENRWEVFLTHSQMVGLANILDMYFEDVYTLPGKQLSCDVVTKPNKLSKRKRGFSVLGFVRAALVTATLLITVGVVVKLCLPHLYSARRRYPGEYNVVASSENDYEQVKPLLLEASKFEAFCCAIVGKIKDGYGWNGDIKFEPSIGAWIGDLPIYLRNVNEAEDIASSTNVLATGNEELMSSLLEYQVVLSSDGRIVGFQPMSHVAVNHWSTNPVAKELYGGKKLSPGLLEPGLKINKPDEVIVLELLMSLDQDNCFALARPVKLP